MAASALVVGGCVTGSVVAGPCFFDPPPGDVSGLSVINDSSSSVVVGECNGHHCRSQYQHLLVSPHTTGSLQIEACSGGELGVTRAGQTSPFGCLREPTEDDNYRLAPVRVSDAQPCVG